MYIYSIILIIHKIIQTQNIAGQFYKMETEGTGWMIILLLRQCLCFIS